jgi:uncharacterized protein
MKRLLPVLVMVFGVFLGSAGESFALPKCKDSPTTLIEVMANWNNCKGVFTNKERGEIGGEFRNGALHGAGYITYLGIHFEGNFKDGNPIGWHNTSTPKEDDYEKGYDLWASKRYEEALRIWIPLANDGHAKSQYYLGFMFTYGNGVYKNYKTAVKWLTLSAENGYPPAFKELGYIYKKGGNGVLQDLSRAHMWYNMRVFVFDIGDSERSRLRNVMTNSEITEATNLARECVRKKYKGC